MPKIKPSIDEKQLVTQPKFTVGAKLKRHFAIKWTYDLFWFLSKFYLNVYIPIEISFAICTTLMEQP